MATKTKRRDKKAKVTAAVIVAAPKIDYKSVVAMHYRGEINGCFHYDDGKWRFTRPVDGKVEFTSLMAARKAIREAEAREAAAAEAKLRTGKVVSTASFGVNNTFTRPLSTRRPSVDVAKLIVRARESAGISKADLARGLGVSRMAITYWERGDREPTLADVGRIAAATGHRLVLEFTKK